MVAKDTDATYWVHEPITGQAWRVAPHNAEMTRFFELGVRAHYYERAENPLNAKAILTFQASNVVSMVGWRRRNT